MAFAGITSTAGTPATANTPSNEAPYKAQLINPPDDLEQLRQLRGELQSELEALRPTTQKAENTAQSQPGVPSPAIVSGDLFNAIGKLVEQIDQNISLRISLSALTSDKALAEFTTELAQIQAQIKSVEAEIRLATAPISPDATRQALTDYQARDADLNARIAAQAERTNARNNSPQERQAAAAAVQTAQNLFRQQSDELKSAILAAKTDEERSLLRRQFRLAEIEASLPLFRRQAIELRGQHNTLLHGREERRIALLKPLVAAMDEYKNVLFRIQTQGEREAIQYELNLIASNPGMSPEHEKLYWEILSLQAEAREVINQRKPPVYPVSALESLKQQIASDTGYWDLFMNGLERRPREQVQAWYWQVQSTKQKWETELQLRRDQLNVATEEHREVLLLLDDYEERIRAKLEEFNEKINAYASSHTGDTHVEQLRQNIAETRRRYFDRTEASKSRLTSLRSRLEEAVRIIEQFVVTTEKNRNRIYWYQLYASERPLWKFSWTKAKAEWTDEAAFLRRQRDIQDLRAAVAAVTTTQWTKTAIWFAAVVAVTIWINAKTKHYIQKHKQRIASTASDEPNETPPLADRMHLFLARLIRRASPVGLPAFALALAAGYGLHGPLRWTMVSIMPLIGGLAASRALVTVLFAHGKPRSRILRCSNKVAAHFRRWTMFAWISTLLFLTVPLLLWSLGWAVYTTEYLCAFYKILILVIALLFGLQRQLVLRVAGRPDQLRHRGLFVLINSLYPLIWGGLAVLLALEIAGYGPLTTYILRAASSTIATLMLAMTLARYVTDRGDRYQKHLREQIAQWQPHHASASDPDDDDGEDAQAPSSPQHARLHRSYENASLVAGILTRLFRWCVAAGAFLLILWYWNISTLEIHAILNYEIGAASSRNGLVVGRILAALAVIAAAWWSSREIRSLLNSKIFPVYTHVDRSARAAVNTILHYFIILLGIYFALYAMQVPLGAVTVVLGTVGLGVGLGLQPLIVNFISGLLILFERHVRVGDIVDVNGQVGEVTSIRMRSTAITTGDNVDLIIPNSSFITQNVTNWTLGETRIRGRIDLGVPYGADGEQVKTLLLEFAKRHPLVLSAPEPVVALTDFAPNAMTFSLFVWFGDVGPRGKFLNEARLEILNLMHKHNIEIHSPGMQLGTIGGKPLPVQIYPPATPSDNDHASRPE